MTAIRRANYPSGSAAERAFWLGSPADLDRFNESPEVYGDEPLRFVSAPGATRSPWPIRYGFLVMGLILGVLLAQIVGMLQPPPCDATSLLPLAQWQPDSAPLRSVRGRVR